ncbi:MAG: YkoF family thiamine/hydroxymethylpyrimidine-binding protein [bacterium]
MNVQAEISLYPLRTDNLGHAIGRFLKALNAAGLTMQPGNMSSTVSGDVNAVFSTMGTAFAIAAEDSQVVLIIKVSNACPSGNAMKGMNDDVG